MNNTEIYMKLTDVKIIEFKKQSLGFFKIFIETESELEKENNNSIWTVIFNTQVEKYIVTNNVEENGLNDVVKFLEIVGCASDLDYAMFLVYDHQKNKRKLVSTIYDEIKNIKNTKVYAKSEWEWAKKNLHKTDVLSKTAQIKWRPSNFQYLHQDFSLFGGYFDHEDSLDDKITDNEDEI